MTTFLPLILIILVIAVSIYYGNRQDKKKSEQAAVVKPQFKTCPYCKESGLLYEATVCKHCKKDLVKTSTSGASGCLIAVGVICLIMAFFGGGFPAAVIGLLVLILAYIAK